MTGMDSRVRKVTWALLGVAIAGLVGALLVSVVVVAQIRGTQVTNTKTTDKSADTLAIIKDCTSPAGKCYKRSQQQTADVVGQIGAGNILAVVCALQVPNGTPLDRALNQVTGCVADKLAEQNR